MNLTSIDKVDSNEKEYEIKSFLCDTDFFYGCVLSEHNVKPICSENLITLDSRLTGVEKIFHEGGIIYFYLQNGKLFSYNDGVLSEFLTYSLKETPIIVKAPINYGKSVLVITSSGAVIKGDTNGKIFLPKGELYYVVDDYVFIADKNSLYFCCGGDENSLLKDNYFGRIDVNESLGDIVGLSLIDNVLTVVSSYGVSTLSVLEDKKDYKLERKISLPVSTVKGTVQRVGADMYFLCGKKLCMLSNGKISYIDFFLENKDYSVIDSYVNGDRYNLKIRYLGTEYLYSYNATQKTEEIFLSDNKVISNDGYVFDKTTKTLLTLNGGVSHSFTVITKELDFGINNEKYIYEIELNGVGEYTLTGEGDFGRKTYRIVGDKPLKRINLQTKKLTLKLSSQNGSSKIDGLKIKYRY